jgi:YVTN family beta-propeller protein
MRSDALIALAIGVSAALAAQGTSGGGSLLVLAKSDLTLSIVDPQTTKVLAQIPSGPDPHEVVASTDGRTAYISNYGGGSLNTITPVDLVGRKALEPINLGALRGPHGLVFSGGKLWFTAEGAKVVGRYDPATRDIDLVLGTGQNRTHMLFVSDDGNRIVTSNVNSATLSILDLVPGGRGQRPGGPPPGGNRGGAPDTPGAAAGTPQRGRGAAGPQTNWDATVVSVGRGVEGLDVSADGREIWAANAQDGTISVVDAASKTVTQTIQASVNGANRLKFTPDGARALVSTLGGPDVTILDVAKRQVLKRIPVGRGAAGIQVQPDGVRAYVSCTPDNNIAVIDLKTLEVAGRLEAGRQPDGLAWASSR